MSGLGTCVGLRTAIEPVVTTFAPIRVLVQHAVSTQRRDETPGPHPCLMTPCRYIFISTDTDLAASSLSSWIRNVNATLHHAASPRVILPGVMVFHRLRRRCPFAFPRAVVVRLTELLRFQRGPSKDKQRHVSCSFTIRSERGIPGTLGRRRRAGNGNVEGAPFHEKERTRMAGVSFTVKLSGTGRRGALREISAHHKKHLKVFLSTSNEAQSLCKSKCLRLRTCSALGRIRQGMQCLMKPWPDWDCTAV